MWQASKVISLKHCAGPNCAGSAIPAIYVAGTVMTISSTTALILSVKQVSETDDISTEVIFLRSLIGLGG